MTVNECYESWMNDNLTDVVDYILGLDSPAQIAYHAAALAKMLQEYEEPWTFMDMLADRMSG